MGVKIFTFLFCTKMKGCNLLLIRRRHPVAQPRCLFSFISTRGFGGFSNGAETWVFFAFLTIKQDCESEQLSFQLIDSSRKGRYAARDSKFFNISRYIAEWQGTPVSRFCTALKKLDEAHQLPSKSSFLCDSSH